jgi:hypothetical protein
MASVVPKPGRKPNCASVITECLSILVLCKRNLYPHFCIHFNDMEIELISNGCQSYELKMLNLVLIMYADDTVLFSENITQLQNMIDCIDSYSKY